MHKRKGITGFEADHLIEQDMCMFQSMVYFKSETIGDVMFHAWD
ncbi:hypothetical protein MKY88_09705 [Lysinibacillus sp. FSL R7-0073]